MRLFGRKKQEQEDEHEGTVGLDPSTDEGIVGLYYSILGRIKADFQNATVSHLKRLHEPGGYAREKSAHDFMALGMDRSYIDALDDLEFTVEDAVTVPQLPLKRRGTAVIVSRWTARGLYSRPGVPGVEPNGEPVTIEGMTYTSFRNFNVRLEYTFWHTPEFTGRMAER